MVNLKTEHVSTTFNTFIGGVNLSGGTNYSVQIPTSTVMIPKPVSYEFRVVEHIDEGKTVKVGLQVQVWEHNSCGAGIVVQDWIDVKRVKKDVATGIVTEL